MGVDASAWGGCSFDLAVMPVGAETLGNWGQTLLRVQSEGAPAAGGLFSHRALADCVGTREGAGVGSRGPSKLYMLLGLCRGTQ